jgi:hypothetical protein
MAKETKTMKELAAWIAEEIGVDGDRVKVYADPAVGWHATVIAAPGQAADLQRRADLAASELRALYDLKA